jgi:hypothetical protein
MKEFIEACLYYGSDLFLIIAAFTIRWVYEILKGE